MKSIRNSRIAEKVGSIRTQRRRWIAKAVMLVKIVHIHLWKMRHRWNVLDGVCHWIGRMRHLGNVLHSGVGVGEGILHRRRMV